MKRFVFDPKTGLWLGRRQALEHCIQRNGLTVALDTNVLLNAYALQTSRSAATVESCRSGLNRGFVIEQNLREAEDRILKKCPDRILDFRLWLGRTGLQVHPDPPLAEWPDWVSSITDQGDRPIAAAAALQHADALITNDTDFAPVAGRIAVHTPAWLAEWRNWMPVPGNRVAGEGFTVFARIGTHYDGPGQRFVWDAGSASVRIEDGKLIGLASGNGRVFEAGFPVSGYGFLTTALTVRPGTGLRVLALDDKSRVGEKYVHCSAKTLDPMPQFSLGGSVNGDRQLNGTLQTTTIYRAALRSTKHIEALIRFGDLALEEYDISLDDLSERIGLLL